MKVSIFGLGYVGSVCAGCLAADGQEVLGIDINQDKVDMINRGRSPVIEKDIDRLIESSVAKGSLRATTDHVRATLDTDISVICVGTPGKGRNGTPDLSQLRMVCEKIGLAIGRKEFHAVVVRSTIPPGTMRQVVIPVIEASSGKRHGTGFSVCHNPEFLREGTGVADFFDPPKVVIGETDPRSGDALIDLHANVAAPIVRTGFEVAEMIKYANNTWHAIKIGFANEIGNICDALGADSQELMEIFCMDTKLNLSPYYLKPGFAFGGSCLPKDLRALLSLGRSHAVATPIIDSVLPSNMLQIERGIQMVIDGGNKKVGVLGFSFKAGTDDLRESPVVELIERLIGKGYDLRLFDRNVDLAKLVGANLNFILNHIPHISRLMVSNVDDVLAHADTIVVGTREPEFRQIADHLRPGQLLVDLVRISHSCSEQGRNYGTRR